jgi:hypothetical protein
VFDAYVNIGSLQPKAEELGERYPRAKFIITRSQDGSSDARTLGLVEGVNGAVLPAEAANKPGFRRGSE